MLKQKKDSSPLHTACQEGNIENVERLLEIRADVNLSDENGFTPLHIAYNVATSTFYESCLIQSIMSQVKYKKLTLIYVATKD